MFGKLLRETLLRIVDVRKMFDASSRASRKRKLHISGEGARGEAALTSMNIVCKLVRDAS